MISNDAFDTLKQRWVVQPLHVLPTLLHAYDPPNLYQRIDLARAARDAPQAHERMKIAIGKIGGSKDLYLRWWESVGFDAQLIRAATECGLHLHYHTPKEAGELFNRWMGSLTDEAHQCALIAWECATSELSRPHLIHNLLDPDDFSELHMNVWREPVANTWSVMSMDQRMDVMVDFLVRSSHERQASNQWCEQWTDVLLDDAPSTPQMVEKCLGVVAQDDTNACLRRLKAYHQGRELHQSTPIPTPRSSVRRV